MFEHADKENLNYWHQSPVKYSAKQNLDNVGLFEQTLWHTCCMFHTGLCPCFCTFKHWKSIWTLKPEAHRCHKAIMSLLLFLMNLLQDDVTGNKSIVWAFKMEMNPRRNNKENAWNSTGLQAFSSSFVLFRSRGVRGRRGTWNAEATEQRKVHTTTSQHAHTDMEGFWTLITHLGRSSDYLWSSAVRKPPPPLPPLRPPFPPPTLCSAVTKIALRCV